MESMNGTTIPAGDTKAWLSTGKRAESHIPVCIRGDLFGDIQELDRQLRELKKATGVTLAEQAEPRRLAERIEALRQQMAEATRVFKIQALGKRGWSELTAAHPPRPDNELDAKAEVNSATFYEALLKKSVIEPELDAEDWDNLRILLTDGQWKELQNTAVGLNLDKVSIPFSSAASATLRPSEPN